MSLQDIYDPRYPTKLRNQLHNLLPLARTLPDSVPLPPPRSPTEAPRQNMTISGLVSCAKDALFAATSDLEISTALRDVLEGICNPAAGHRWTHVRGATGAESVLRCLMDITTMKRVTGLPMELQRLRSAVEDYEGHLRALHPTWIPAPDVLDPILAQPPTPSPPSQAANPPLAPRVPSAEILQVLATAAAFTQRREINRRGMDPEALAAEVARVKALTVEEWEAELNESMESEDHLKTPAPKRAGPPSQGLAKNVAAMPADSSSPAPRVSYASKAPDFQVKELTRGYGPQAAGTILFCWA